MNRTGLSTVPMLSSEGPANAEVIRVVIEQGERALASARAAGDRRAEMAALIDLGAALARSGQAPKGAAYLEEAVAAARAVGDAALERDAVGSLGWATLVLSELPRGLELLEESLRLARSAGDRIDEKTALY